MLLGPAGSCRKYI